MASMQSMANTSAAGAGLNAVRTGSSDVVTADTSIVPSAPTGPPSGRPQPKASEKVRLHVLSSCCVALVARMSALVQRNGSLMHLTEHRGMTLVQLRDVVNITVVLKHEVGWGRLAGTTSVGSFSAVLTPI